MAAKDLFDSDELFYLKWNNFQTNINNQFERLRENDDLVDVTFACEGKKIGAHKLILFACSPYFKDLLKTNSPHSVFFMYGVRYEILKAIIEYMYLGEVHISNENLKDFIQTAESLQIRGLTKDQAIKIPKPVIEVSASDLMSGHDGHGSHHHHFDHSLKKVVRRGGKRMRTNEDGSIDANHLYLSNEAISVEQPTMDVGKHNIPMPKPLDKRGGIYEEGQVEPKLEMDDTVEMPSYCSQRSINHHNPNQHTAHHSKTTAHQIQPGHVSHMHTQLVTGQPQPLQTTQQQQTIPASQTTTLPQHIATPSTSQIIDSSAFDRPGTSHSQQNSIKSDYDQLTESNQTTPSDDDKFKDKRDAGTPKLTKCQESSRVCPVCSRLYSSVSNLRQHMRLIHNPTYVCCPICQKYFNTDLYLRRHISGIHRGENIDWPPPYENNQTTPNSIC